MVDAYLEPYKGCSQWIMLFRVGLMLNSCPGWAEADVNSFSACCHSWVCRIPLAVCWELQDRLFLSSTRWGSIFVCRTGSLEQQNLGGLIPGFPFACSIWGWHAPAVELWSHRNGIEACFYFSHRVRYLYEESSLNWDNWKKKVGLIKEHLQWCEGIHRSDTYNFCPEHNLSLS